MKGTLSTAGKGGEVGGVVPQHDDDLRREVRDVGGDAALIVTGIDTAHLRDDRL